jgi:hypothetical protein
MGYGCSCYKKQEHTNSAKKKMEDCVNGIWMPLLQETEAQLQNMKKSEIQLPLVVPDLVYTFQMICLRAAEAIEWKPNAGHNAWNALYANPSQTCQCCHML